MSSTSTEYGLTVGFSIEQPWDKGSLQRVRRLLASPRFAHRPKADPNEVKQRIETLRNDWGDC